MPRSLNPKIKRIPPIAVTEAQQIEIARLADIAQMTVAEYVRERALGNKCPPIAVVSAPKGRQRAGARS